MEKDVALREWCIARALEVIRSGTGAVSVDDVVEVAIALELYITSGQTIEKLAQYFYENKSKS